MRRAEGTAYRQRVIANVVAAGTPLQGGEAAHNVMLAYRPDLLDVAVPELTPRLLAHSQAARRLPDVLVRELAAYPDWQEAIRPGARSRRLRCCARWTRPSHEPRGEMPAIPAACCGWPRWSTPRLSSTAAWCRWNSAPLPWDEAVARFGAIPFLKLGIGSRADWMANLLLFIPLTFLWMGALAAWGSRLRSCAVPPWC